MKSLLILFVCFNYGSTMDECSIEFSALKYFQKNILLNDKFFDACSIEFCKGLMLVDKNEILISPCEKLVDDNYSLVMLNKKIKVKPSQQNCVELDSLKLAENSLPTYTDNRKIKVNVSPVAKMMTMALIILEIHTLVPAVKRLGPLNCKMR